MRTKVAMRTILFLDPRIEDHRVLGGEGVQGLACGLGVHGRDELNLSDGVDGREPNGVRLAAMKSDRRGTSLY